MNGLSYIQTLLLVCPLVFLAGFVDSIAGGGGLISLPAYLAAGLPAHIAAGSNKFAMMLGTSVSVSKYSRSGNIKLKTALLSAAAALPGAWIGTKIALFLDERYLKTAMLVVIPSVAIFLLFNRGFVRKPVEENTETGKFRLSGTHAGRIGLSLVIGLVIGCYDGLIGPGTGTFLMIAFASLLQYSLLVSSGNAKIVNLASNVMSAILFIASGNVWFALAIPAAFCTVAGNWLGSHLAIRNGVKIIRPVMFVVLALLFAKIVSDIF